MERRKFILRGVQAGTALGLLGLYACKNGEKKDQQPVEEEFTPFFELSLAQWSLHRAIWDGMDPYKFAEEAKRLGFKGLEYVSQLYPELEASGYSEEAMTTFVDRCNEEAKKHGMENVLIMVDGQGNLATADEKAREEAVENHYKWVDAAAAMGCHAIRVNLDGNDDARSWVDSSSKGLAALCEYAAPKQISVLVENHGGFSSNASLLVEVMENVSMDNCGTLPDFGNFCIRKEDPSDWGSPCVESYDAYRGVRELLPYAQAVSAKSYHFNENGEETKIDYQRMLSLVHSSGYKGYVGVEYEGDKLDEEAGIIATKKLILKAAKQLPSS